MTALFVVLFLSAASEAGGQIQGRVIDSSGASLDNAAIRVDDAKTGDTVTRVYGGQDGGFQVPQLKPGNYMLTAWQRGFIAGELTQISVRNGETTDAGTIRLDVAECDAPGISCLHVYAAGTPVPPPAPPEVRKHLDLLLAVGANGKFEQGDLRFMKDGGDLYLIATNGARISAANTAYIPRLRLDGRGPEVSFYVHHVSGAVSHVYLIDEVDRNATEVRLWCVTRPH